MKPRVALFALITLALAGCGADGEPIQPTMDVGIGVGTGGAYGWGGLGLHQGPVSVYLGF